MSQKTIQERLSELPEILKLLDPKHQVTLLKALKQTVKQAVKDGAKIIDQASDHVRENLIKMVPKASDVIIKVESVVDGTAYKAAEVINNGLDILVNDEIVKETVTKGAILFDKGTDLAREELIKLAPNATPMVKIVENVVDKAVYDYAADIAEAIDNSNVKIAEIAADHA